jgi:hypothetical protein
VNALRSGLHREGTRGAFLGGYVRGARASDGCCELGGVGKHKPTYEDQLRLDLHVRASEWLVAKGGELHIPA